MSENDTKFSSEEEDKKKLQTKYTVLLTILLTCVIGCFLVVYKLGGRTEDLPPIEPVDNNPLYETTYKVQPMEEPNTTDSSNSNEGDSELMKNSSTDSYVMDGKIIRTISVDVQNTAYNAVVILDYINVSETPSSATFYSLDGILGYTAASINENGSGNVVFFADVLEVGKWEICLVLDEDVSYGFVGLKIVPLREYIYYPEFSATGIDKSIIESIVELDEDGRPVDYEDKHYYPPSEEEISEGEESVKEEQTNSSEIPVTGTPEETINENITETTTNYSTLPDESQEKTWYVDENGNIVMNE